MEAMEMLLGRRSIRKFKSEQIKDSELEAVLKAGEYAPSGGNQQGAFYIVVQEPEARKKIAEMNAAVMGKSGTDPYYGAPTVILAFAEQGKATPFGSRQYVQCRLCAGPGIHLDPSHASNV